MTMDYLFAALLSRGSNGGGGGGATIDTEVNGTSENAVQNKAIYSFVNSSVATNTAYFQGTYKTLADLEAVTPVTNNDYGFVIVVESAILTTSEPADWSTNWTDYYTESGGVYTPVGGDTAPTWQADTYYQADGVRYDRYKYNSETTQWTFEYSLNNSSFTANEWATIQSGLTAADKANLVDLLARLIGIQATDSNYIQLTNGQRVYFSATAPTGDIPDGSVGVGW